MLDSKGSLRWLVQVLIATIGTAVLVLYVAVRPRYDFGTQSWSRTTERPAPRYVTQLADFAPGNATRTLVTGGLEDESPPWLALLPTNMAVKYYPVLQDPAAYTNKGHEAMFYLRFIVDHYDNLPDYMVYVHDHKRAWHNSDAIDRSILHLLSDIRWPYVEREGFVNLRCQSKPNCPSILPLRGFVRAGKMESFFESAWTEVFAPEFGPMGQIAATCCAQFAVTREAVHLRSLDFYKSLVHWLETSDGSDWQLGRVLEYTWHIIFGKSFVHCPDSDTCRRNLYGYQPELF